METETYTTHSEDETIKLGRKFAEKLNRGDVVLFFGDLGSGKTEFAKGICKYYNVEEIVTSPTFTIMNQYNGSMNDDDLAIYHIDLYRIKTKRDLDEIGFEDCLFSADAIKLVEWAENAGGLVKFSNYQVKIRADFDNENERLIEISQTNISSN